MKNKLGDLNNHLFAAIERLNDEGLSADQIEQEAKRADADLRAAFIDGAMSTHTEWLRAHEAGEAPPRGEPEFGEAADDYVARARRSASGRGDDLRAIVVKLAKGPAWGDSIRGWLDKMILEARDALSTSADDPKPIARFGHGTLVVDTGHHFGIPAVFVGPSKRAGPVGGKVPDDEKMPNDRLIEGEFFFTFPTDEQAKLVADALVNASRADLRAENERLRNELAIIALSADDDGGWTSDGHGRCTERAAAALSTPAGEKEALTDRQLRDQIVGGGK